MLVSNNYKFDFDDVLVRPKTISSVRSRSEVSIKDENGFLPLFAAPMFDVINEENTEIFQNHKIYTIQPRQSSYTIDDLNRSSKTNFIALSLTEFDKLIIGEVEGDISRTKTHYILIDIANGHMSALVDSIKMAKKMYGKKLVLMVGNIANPTTYEVLARAGADYIRVGIGCGSACTTTANAAAGYPMGSLIAEMYAIKYQENLKAKIVADGGFRKFADIIKALALGADYVMIGGMFNKCVDLTGEFFKEFNQADYGLAARSIPASGYVSIKQETAIALFKEGTPVFKRYRGMSTKSAQKDMGNKVLKTAEGIEKYNKCELMLDGWIDNFQSYLKSNMSYSNCNDIRNYPYQAECVLITPFAYKRFNK